MVNLGHWRILNIYIIFISLLLYIEKQIGQGEKYVIKKKIVLLSCEIRKCSKI